MDHYRLLQKRARGRTAAVKLVILGASVLGLMACASDREPVAEAPAVKTVSGFIIAVEAKSIAELVSLDVEDAQRVMWHFVARDFKGFTPSHLRDHMVQGAPVSVRYHEENSTFIIEEITD